MAVEQPHFVYVEDDAMSRQIVKVLLQNVLGYQDLTLFPDSTDLLDRLRAVPGQPNVFFLDIQIGPYDGYEMLKMLRKTPEFSDATIIAMTANVMSYDVDTLRSAGFDGLIGKPIRQKVFPDLVRRLLDGETVWYVP